MHILLHRYFNISAILFGILWKGKGLLLLGSILAYSIQSQEYEACLLSGGRDIEAPYNQVNTAQFIDSSGAFPFDFWKLPGAQPAPPKSDPDHTGEKVTKISGVRVVGDDIAAEIVVDGTNRTRKESAPQGKDHRTKVSLEKRQKWPHSIHGHLIAEFSDKKRFVGTGVLVGPNHVLTAAHNIYNHGTPSGKKRGWAKKVTFAPARHESAYPFASQKGCVLLCPNDWVNQKSGDKKNDDFAIVVLDYSIGRWTGWSGLMCLPSYLELGSFSIAGYPIDKGFGGQVSTQMWEMKGKIKSKENLFEYEISTAPGQSGSAIWCKINEEVYTVGVHVEGGNRKNIGVRLTPERLKLISRWIFKYWTKDLSLDLSQIFSKMNSPYISMGDEVSKELSNVSQQLLGTQYGSWLQGASKGQADDLFHLASLYKEGGEGIEKDEKLSFRLFREAATRFFKQKESNLELQAGIVLGLATYYQTGRGEVVRDILEAIRLYRYAKKNGNKTHKSILYQLGRCLECIDKSLSVKYLEKARELGYPIPDPQETRTTDASIVNSRIWTKVLETYPPCNLSGRPKNFQESKSEGEDQSYLTSLWRKFHESADSHSMREVAVTGMGGVGKSTLALAYAYEALENKAYNLICWLKSDTEPALEESYRGLLKLLKIESVSGESIADLISSINEAIPNQGLSLLIYDNVPHAGFLVDKVPQLGVHILITSRCQEGFGIPTIPLSVFQQEEAVKYLFDRIGIEETDDSKQQAQKVVQELGCLPLALSHAASYIAYQRRGNKEYSFNQYLKHFQRCAFALLEFNSRYSLDSTLDHEYLINTTINMAQEAISEPAKKILTCLAYLDPDVIMREYLPTFDDEPDPITNHFSDLVTFSLIKENNDSFSIHRLVQLAIRAEHEQPQNIDGLYSVLGEMLSGFVTYRQSERDHKSQERSLDRSKKLYMQYSSLNSNLDTLQGHLDRLSKLTHSNS